MLSENDKIVILQDKAKNAKNSVLRLPESIFKEYLQNEIEVSPLNNVEWNFSPKKFTLYKSLYEKYPRKNQLQDRTAPKEYLRRKYIEKSMETALKLSSYNSLIEIIADDLKPDPAKKEIIASQAMRLDIDPVTREAMAVALSLKQGEKQNIINGTKEFTQAVKSMFGETIKFYISDNKLGIGKPIYSKDRDHIKMIPFIGEFIEYANKLADIKFDSSDYSKIKKERDVITCCSLFLDTATAYIANSSAFLSNSLIDHSALTWPQNYNEPNKKDLEKNSNMKNIAVRYFKKSLNLVSKLYDMPETDEKTETKKQSINVISRIDLAISESFKLLNSGISGRSL